MPLVPPRFHRLCQAFASTPKLCTELRNQLVRPRLTAACSASEHQYVDFGQLSPAIIAIGGMAETVIEREEESRDDREVHRHRDRNG